MHYTFKTSFICRWTTTEIECSDHTGTLVNITIDHPSADSWDTSQLYIHDLTTLESYRVNRDHIFNRSNDVSILSVEPFSQYPFQISFVPVNITSTSYTSYTTLFEETTSDVVSVTPSGYAIPSTTYVPPHRDTTILLQGTFDICGFFELAANNQTGQ